MNIIAREQPAGFAPEIRRDPDLDIQSGELSEVLQVWHALRGDRLMPARADIRPADFRRHLALIALVDVQRSPLRVRYRLMGTAIVNALRRDLTGRWYDEVYPPAIMAEVEQVYGWIVANRRPLRTSGVALFFDRSMYDYEVVNLPLSEDGKEVDMVLGAMRFTMAEGPPVPPT
ncbi:PAS domain-containing protein [Marinibaculum pumilum]|uniref:PAS domain-containing protein n=1 Tax=Marinibaculum pumilum TaxID=1766165 RepID=A0ABV7L3H5_9PROT